MRKSIKIALIALAAVVVVAGASVAIFWDNVTNLVAKTVKDPSEYYVHVEKSNLESTTSNLYTILKLEEESKDNKVGLESSFKVEIGEGLSSVIEKIAGEKIDIEWLKNVEISSESYLSNDINDFTVVGKLNDKELFSATGILDIKNESAYFSVPLVLGDKVIKINGNKDTENSENSEDSEYGETATMSSVFGLLFGENNVFKKFVDALPTEEVLSKMIVDYFEIIVDNFGEAEKSSDKLSIDGVEQSCTLVTMTIDEREFYNAIKAVMEHAKTDKEIERMIRDFIGSMDPEIVDVTPDEAYNEFVEAVSDVITEMDEELVSIIDKPEEELKSESFIFKTWVNSKGGVVAREIKDATSDGGLFIGTTKDGSDVATKISFCEDGGDEIVNFSGKGTLKKGKLSGEYSLFVEHREIINVNVKDFDLKALRDDNALLGTFGISVGDDFVDYVLSGGPDEIVNLVKTAEIKISLSENAFSVEFISDSKLCVKLSTTVKEKTYRAPAIPDESKVIDVEDEEKLDEIMADFNIQTIIDKFVEAGVPQDLIDSITAKNESPDMPEIPEWNEDFDEDWDENWDEDWDEEWGSGEVWEEWATTEAVLEF